MYIVLHLHIVFAHHKILTSTFPFFLPGISPNLPVLSTSAREVFVNPVDQTGDGGLDIQGRLVQLEKR